MESCRKPITIPPGRLGTVLHTPLDLELNLQGRESGGDGEGGDDLEHKQAVTFGDIQPCLFSIGARPSPYAPPRADFNSVNRIQALTSMDAPGVECILNVLVGI
jgi:hypothetical protein